MKQSIKYLIIALLGIFSQASLHAQFGCTLLDACGDINPSGGFPSGTAVSFCEGETVIFANTTTNADSTYFNWGDGVTEGFAGTPDGVHVYNIQDTCLSGGFVQLPIVMTVVRHCPAGVSRNCLISFIKIKVKPLPDFAPTDILCTNVPIDFDNNTCENGSNTTYKWTVSTGFMDTTETITQTFVTPGVYSVTLTATNGCGPESQIHSFYVKGPPQVDSILADAQPASGCVPVKVIFSAIVTDISASNGYEWTVVPQNPCSNCYFFTDSTTKDSPSPHIIFTQAGTYQVCLEGSNECGEESLCFTIVVFSPPGVTLTPPPPQCNSLDYTPNPVFSGSITSYTWNFPLATPPVSSNLQNPGIIHYEALTDIVQDTATLLISGPCGDSLLRIPITVTPKVTLTIQPPALPVCAGGAPIQIQASHPACFSGGPYISATGLFTPPALPGQYIIQSAFPCNGPPDCISSAELVISVLPVTVVTLSGPSPLCVDGAPVNFTANPTGGVWLPAPGLTDVNLGTFDPALAGPGMHILAHQFNASNGCVSQPSISVEVVDVPTVTAPDTLRTCHIPQGVDLLLLGGNSFSFNPSGGSFTWTGTGVDPQTGIFTSSGLDTIAINVAYTLQPGPPGCTSSETFELIISPFVNAVAGADDEVCQNTNNGQYMLNANPAGGSWSGTSVDPQTGIVNLLSVPTGVPLVYVYTLQEGTPCVSRDTTILIVFPGDGVQTPPLAYVCETELNFTLPSGIPVNGDWVGPFENNGIVDVSQLDTGLAYVYTYTVPGLPAACASAELELYVLAEPDGGFEYSDDTLCVGSIGFFSAHDTVGVLYAWDFGDGTSSTLPDPEHTWTSSGDYLVRLTVFLPDPLAPGQFVCINGSQTTIRVVAPPLLQIALSPDTICPYEGVAFENLSTGEAVSGFFWDFGNNQTYVGFEPGDSIYYAPGIEDTLYTITLTVSGACPDAVASVNLLVHPLPYLSLVPSLDNTCSGDTLTFSVGFTGGSIFNITFSAHDTATTGLPLPALTFFTPNDSTQLTVVAVVAGENQCAATTDTAIIQILPNEANAFCDLNVPVICVGDTLIITNGATPLDAAVSYDFGDGTTSNDPNPRKVYSQAGTYKIRQTARTFCGYDFVDRWIQVNPAPAAGFAHDAYRCVGDSMHFWLTVDSLARTVDWDFGFGNVSTAFSPLAAFPQSGIFPVTLTITLDSSGCDASVTELVEIKANPVAQFTASDTLACGRLETTLLASPAGSQYNYGWFASNGNTAAGNPANFVFSDSGSYSVRLLVQDLWGCQDDTSLFIFRVFPVPNSNFSMNLNWHCGLPANVVLNEQASADALGFEWLFPDGSSSTSNNTAHTFLQAGDFPIRLRVSNLYGCSDDTIRVFRVFEQPVANFTITDPAPCQFSILEIENQSEYANAWLWTFHYGDTSRLETPRYAFPQPGVFDISLIAMRDSFCFDTLTLTGIVDIKPAPVAGFFVVDSMPNGYPEGLFYIFSTAIGAEVWAYDFGNGQGSSLENPVVRYGQNLRYTIQQIVINQWMCRDTAWLDTIPAPFGGLFVPNAFAPEVSGGDYAYFMPKGRGLANYRVRVYAPTGKMVFESTELINGSPGQGWDGNDFNGKPCQQGAYAWVIEAEYETNASNAESLDAGSRKVVESGSVVLLR